MSPATAAPLIFNWEGPRRRNLAMTGFLGLSLAAHVACFYLFQIVYPTTVSLIPGPERVNFISARSEEGAALLQWVDAEDPALASTTRRSSDVRRYLLGKIPHIPSYSESEPILKAAPPLTVDLRVPSAQPPGAVPFRQSAKPAQVGSVSTKVTFSAELQRLGEPSFAPTNFKASTHEPPQNAQFRIAIDPRGAVVYCFAVNSSGDAALDEQARQHLVLCRFSTRALSSTDSLVWGIATIEWGNDVASANPTTTPSAP